MALGATREQIVALVVKEGLALACIGSVTGLIGACFVGRAMQSTLFSIPATDVPTLIAGGLGLLLPALFACYHPALRAATMEIMQALKRE